MKKNLKKQYIVKSLNGQYICDGNAFGTTGYVLEEEDYEYTVIKFDSKDEIFDLIDEMNGFDDTFMIIPIYTKVD